MSPYLGVFDLPWMPHIPPVLLSLAVRVERDGAGPGSLTDDGLRYDVIDGEALLKATDVWRWARQMANVCSEKVRIGLVVSPHVKSAVNVNLLRGRGERYELHTDSVPWTLLAFGSGDHVGGELLADLPTGRVQIVPRFGLGVLFQGDLIPHAVAPLLDDSTRISLPVALWPVGTYQRPADLDSHLYGGGDE